ncbi:MAG: NIL domain-containing protein [Phycisphaeraceae bacterium]|nr:NIL domain-containing protein [Phycisphaeraceae bacterium]
MPTITRKCWLTFEGGCQDQPCIWRMSRRYPDVVFDVRQASVGQQIGIMALKFDGDEAEIDGAIAFLQEMGVKVDPVEGGSLVES